MKRIILNLLQTVTEEVHGEQMWDEILRTNGLDGAYTGLGDHPDQEVTALVSTLARRTDRDESEVLRWFGRCAIPHLAQRYPDFFTHEGPVSFVLTLHGVIHAEVRKLYPGAQPPIMSFSEVTSTTVTIDYRSRRALSDLAIGFLHGAADAYGHRVESQRTLLDPAGTHVSLRCRFSPA